MGEIIVEKSMEVNATPQAIWDEMVKIDTWPEWKPFIKKAGASGYECLANGVKFKMTIQVGGPAAVPLSATISEFDQPGRLVWEGGVKGIFHAVHSFDFKESGDKTLVVTREEFKGALTGILNLMVGRDDLEALHQKWLEAIKKRVEK